MITWYSPVQSIHLADINICLLLEWLYVCNRVRSACCKQVAAAVQSVSTNGAASCSSASIQPPLKSFKRLAFDISSANQQWLLPMTDLQPTDHRWWLPVTDRKRPVTGDHNGLLGWYDWQLMQLWPWYFIYDNCHHLCGLVSVRHCYALHYIVCMIVYPVLHYTWYVHDCWTLNLILRKVACAALSAACTPLDF